MEGFVPRLRPEYLLLCFDIEAVGNLGADELDKNDNFDPIHPNH